MLSLDSNMTNLVSTNWQIRDRGNEYTSDWNTIIDEIFEGKINPTANIYDKKTNQWVSIAQRAEFNFAFPIFPFLQYGNNFKQLAKLFEKHLVGIVSIASNWKELFPIAKSFRTSGLPRGTTFFIPIVEKNVKRRVTRPVAFYHVHDNFLVSCFFEDRKVVASTESPLFVLAYNVSTDAVDHTLHSYEFPIPEKEKSKLSFSVRPQKWSLRILQVDTSLKSGECKLEFRSASNTGRAAKFGLAAALTLGMVRYTPGYKGFLVPFEIVPANFEPAIDERLKKAELLYQLNDYLAAKEQLEVAVKLEPDSSLAHKLLGMVFSMLNENDKAEQELNVAIRLKPDDDDAHNNLATVLGKMNRNEEAEKHFKEAIGMNPDNLINRYNLAIFYKKNNRINEAKTQYLEILKRKPEFMPAYQGIYSLLHKSNKTNKEDLINLYSEAETIFANAISKIPNNANLHSYLGYTQLHLRKFKEAEREFNVALRLDKKNPTALVFLALKKKGEWEHIGVAK